MEIPPDLVEKQKFFQTAQGLVHRKTRADRITSVIIPAGLTLAAAYAMVRVKNHPCAQHVRVRGAKTETKRRQTRARARKAKQEGKEVGWEVLANQGESTRARKVHDRPIHRP
eukprot:scaffold1146_cov339-Pavlova_lutheri.AAC.15